MSLVVTLAFAVAVVVAPLTEWALRMFVSTPELDKTDFSHLAIVNGVTGL